jgi:hypothetical protein
MPKACIISNMIPAGYMAKRVVVRPEWINAKQVDDVLSVSGCVSTNFADYIKWWEHNGFWLFDAPEIITRLAKAHSLDMNETRLFFYEVYESEFDDDTKQWKHFSPEPSFKTQVIAPPERTLMGFDVVTFSVHTSPECSPLSCNSLAQNIPTNSHCLIATFDDAKRLVEEERFDNSEPGPFRVFAVYETRWP